MHTTLSSVLSKILCESLIHIHSELADISGPFAQLIFMKSAFVTVLCLSSGFEIIRDDLNQCTKRGN